MCFFTHRYVHFVKNHYTRVFLTLFSPACFHKPGWQLHLILAALQSGCVRYKKIRTPSKSVYDN